MSLRRKSERQYGNKRFDKDKSQIDFFHDLQQNNQIDYYGMEDTLKRNYSLDHKIKKPKVYLIVPLLFLLLA